MEAFGWKQLFSQWPADLPRRGVVIASFGEQIPFAGFHTSETMLLVERTTPDTMGARLVLVPYENVDAVKIVDVVKPAIFGRIGFSGPPSKR